MGLEKEIYKALLGEKKVEIINLLCELSDENGFVMLKISAIITRESVHNLALKAGDKVTAIIKATQIIVGVK